MTGADPLWVIFPRWIEESEIPTRLTEECGSEGWVIFRKLIELDCDANLTPDWFSFRQEDLARWSGMNPGLLLGVLNTLDESGWIERNNVELAIQDARILSPPPGIEVEETKIHLSSQFMGRGHFVLRYLDHPAGMEKAEQLIYLYQMLFGAKFSPRIVEDLQEMAALYPMDVLYPLFQEAYRKKVKTLAWIQSRLPEIIPQTLNLGPDEG